jgi:putative tryptophan/tyrosine transport system substrate-binding protein
MRRRELISLLCGASAWPFAASAQQAMVLVGLLTGGQVEDRQINALRQALREAGYIEGRNLAIKYCSAGGRFDRLPELAAELVADPVAAIFAAGPSAAVAAKAATATIPIVFVSGADPIDLSLVASTRGETVGIAAGASAEHDGGWFSGKPEESKFSIR